MRLALKNHWLALLWLGPTEARAVLSFEVNFYGLKYRSKLDHIIDRAIYLCGAFCKAEFAVMKNIVKFLWPRRSCRGQQLGSCDCKLSDIRANVNHGARAISCCGNALTSPKEVRENFGQVNTALRRLSFRFKTFHPVFENTKRQQMKIGARRWMPLLNSRRRGGPAPRSHRHSLHRARSMRCPVGQRISGPCPHMTERRRKLTRPR